MRERKNGVIEWTMRHYQITLLVITVLVGLGIWGLVDMPKQEFPEFTIRQGVVVGVYPGATSGEVEEQLAKPLERYLFTFKEVKKKKTYSIFGSSQTHFWGEPQTPAPTQMLRFPQICAPSIDRLVSSVLS